MVSEVREPIRLCAATCTGESVPTPPECRFDRTELSPATDALTIEFRGFGKHLQAARNSPVELIFLKQGEHVCLQKGAAVVRRISHEPFRIYRQPRLALCAEDVARVQITMDHNLGLISPKLTKRRDRRLNNAPRQRVREVRGISA